MKCGDVLFFVVNWHYDGKHGPTPGIDPSYIDPLNDDH
jgi:hypothetical protein